MVILCRPHWLVLILNSKQSYHISTVTVLLHVVTTIRIFIKSPEEGQVKLTVRNIGKTNSLVVVSLLFFHYSLFQ